MFRGVKWEEALKDAKRYEEERAKEGDAVRIRPYKNGGETNIFREGLKVLFPKPAKPYKNGGGFWDEALRVPKETYVPLPKDYSPILMKTEATKYVESIYGTREQR
jgi:threonine dehydrogenase-like Zn-dependent dehydrogenase